jgi:hypothetical protein
LEEGALEGFKVTVFSLGTQAYQIVPALFPEI